MSNNTKKLINRIIMVLTCCMILFSLSCVYGQGTIDPSTVTKPSIDLDKEKTAIDKIAPIIGAITTIGVIVSVVTLIVLGIKYMVGSIEEKAEYKKSMIPYLIGAFFVFAISTVVTIIMQFTEILFPTTWKL